MLNMFNIGFLMFVFGIFLPNWKIPIADMKINDFLKGAGTATIIISLL